MTSTVFVECDGPRETGGAVVEGYCLHHLVRRECDLIDLCGPCLAWVMTHLDLAAGEDLPWHSDFRQVSGLPTRRRWIVARHPFAAVADAARRAFRAGGAS